MVLRSRLPVVLALLLCGWAGRVGAVSIVPVSTPIPDELVLLDFNGTGLDWVYAGPYSPDGTPPAIEDASYRAAEGWRHATDAEWELRPDWSDFILPGFTAEEVLEDGATHLNYRYASEYWSEYDLVNEWEAAEGAFYRNYDGHPAWFILPEGSLYWDPGEVWYVRTHAAAVPDAGSTAALLLTALGGLLLSRRRAA